ncbi:MAG: hypothetical protein WAW63_05650 [Candidatus Saccharimonadales bacterium]
MIFKKVFLSAVVSASVLSLGFGATANAYSTDPTASYDKVYVCKFVDTPEEGEVLQTGQNPISVSKNAIDDFGGLGSSFNDRQGRSYVVAWDTGDKVEPPVQLCYGYTSVEIPAVPSVTDPCGQANATWNIPADTEEVVWELDSETGVLTAYIADEGLIFTDGSTEHSYGTAQDSNVACVVTPPAGGGGGAVLGAQTVAPVTPQLEDTGMNSAISAAISTGIVLLASLTVLQSTSLGLKLRSTFAQPFANPTA